MPVTNQEIIVDTKHHTIEQYSITNLNLTEWCHGEKSCIKTNLNPMNLMLVNKTIESIIFYSFKFILAPTFAALIPARRCSRFALACAAARRSTIIIIKKKQTKKLPFRESNMHANHFRFKVHRLNHSTTEATLLSL